MDAVACQAADRDGEVPQESEAAGARLRWMAACGLVKLGYARAEGVLAQLLREGFDDCLERGELSTDEGKTEFAEQKRRRAAAVETLVGFAAAAAAERRLRNAEGPAFAELRRPRQLAAEDDARFVLRAVANGLSSSSWRVRHGCAECAGRILGLLPPDQPWPEEVSAAGCPEASAAAAATPPPARPEAARGGALAAAKEPARPPPAAEEDPAEASARETTDLCTSVLRKLLGVFWNDWNHDVRASAGAELTKLDAGRSIFLWAVELIKGDHPVRRVDALRTLACLKTLAKSALPAYLDCFRDSYVVVRVEACKVACVLGTPQKQVVDALLDSLEDCDTRVRAYALKALGRSKCTSRHVTDALLFHATHEHHPAVRAEACRAAAKLGCVAGNRDMVRALSDLVLGDVSERVRREAAAALQATGEAAVPRSEAEPKPLTTATGGILPAAAESEAAVVDAVRVLSTTAAFRRQALNDYVVGGGCLPLSLSEDTDAMAALLKVTKQPELSYKIRMAKTTRGNLLLRYKDA
ncbi:MAG: armadillo-type protein [Olpidium bornovanus]|uniref:Armadillo-type protein n=1 Tax=Olpidium bornovanus TaxID=278681 RepID=A0A8H7ZY39_9FUNG|nr:MAG: armadillo-type protein [Olpidium bornovanus]